MLEQFKEYLEYVKRNNKTEELRLFKLIIFGPPRVGKSTLFKVLVAEELEQNSNSTGIFHRQLFKVAITQRNIQKSTQIDTSEYHSEWDIISIQNEISRLKLVLEEEKKNSEKTNKPKVKIDNTASLPLTKVENEMLKEYDEPYPLPNTAIKKYTSTLMVCYDSGGQPEFFDILPALATNPTGYIMVFDLSKNLDEPNKYEIVIKGEKYLPESKISSIEMMKGAIAGIQPHCSNNCLLIVGTHLKECLNPEQQAEQMEESNPQQRLKDIDKQINDDIVKRKAKAIVKRRTRQKTQCIYPIDNLVKCNDRDCIAQEIRSAVERMTEDEKTVRTEIPIKWHLFQLEIQLHIESTLKKNYIS